MIKPRESGFTIAELMIAAAFFSLALVFALTGFFQVGRLFYKGVALTQTQALAKKIVDNFTLDVQFAPTVGSPGNAGKGTNGKPRQFLCVGNIRYTYILGNEVILSEESDHTQPKDDTFGLLRDILLGAAGCSNPFPTHGGPNFNKPVELLANKMRLSLFNLTPVKNSQGQLITDLWNIDLKMAYGDDNVLTNPSDPDKINCNGNLTTSQYCSVTELKTTISRGY